MYTATISSKYQVVIPREVRERYGVKPGLKLVFIPLQHTLRIVVVPPIEDAEGFLQGIETTIERDEEDRV